MTPPVFASVLFSRFFIFIIGLIFTNGHISFSHPKFLIIFSMGLIFNFLKQNTDGQEQKVF